MNDLFTALAERAVAHVPDVRPLIIPRFAERDAGDTGPAVFNEIEEMIEISPVTGYERAAQAVRTAMSDLREDTPPTPVLANRDARVSVESLERPAIATDARVEHDDAARLRIDDVEAPIPVEPVLAPEDVTPRETLVVVTRQSSGREPAMQVRESSAVPECREPPIHRVSAQAVSARRDVRPRPSLDFTARLDAAAPPQHYDDQLPAKPAIDSGPEAPDVHITIGRVEVRAILATAAPSRSVAASRHEPLGLDAYLSAREGNAR